MKIPNYDVKDDSSSNYKQKVSFMPDRCFRMLICAPSGGGKTNLLLDMIYRLVYYDKIYLYAKNLQQNKYQHLMKLFEPISEEIGYPIIETSNNKIIPLSELSDDNTDKTIRLNCTHYCIFEFPSQNEQNMICRELGISKSKYQKATQDPYSFLYLDKLHKFISKNFDEHII